MSKKGKELNNINSKSSFKLPDISLTNSFFQSLLEFEDKYPLNQTEKEKEKEEINDIKNEGYELLEPELEKKEKVNEDNNNEDFFGLSQKEKNVGEEDIDKNVEKNIDVDDLLDIGNSKEEEGKFEVDDFFFGEDDNKDDNKENEKNKENVICEKKEENKKKVINDNKNIKKDDDKGNSNFLPLTEDEINLMMDNYLEEEDNQDQKQKTNIINKNKN